MIIVTNSFGAQWVSKVYNVKVSCILDLFRHLIFKECKYSCHYKCYKEVETSCPGHKKEFGGRNLLIGWLVLTRVDENIPEDLPAPPTELRLVGGCAETLFHASHKYKYTRP